MAVGKQGSPDASKDAAKARFSPIVQAIADAERGTTGEIRVHLTKRWIDRDPFRSAERIFKRLKMSRTAHRNAVLLYVNSRKRTFAIYGDIEIHKHVGQAYWEALAKNLKSDLQSTHFENAIALAVRTIGATLSRFFPADLDAPFPHELSNEVTTD